MNYTQAIELAKNGDEKGFEFLYENTYKSKYYLALQYMKDEEAAQDVLQEAYLKAFQKLDTLSQPEAFAGWLGMIVANTAKNALKKKNPMLFSDVAVNNEDESFEYEIEDENIENQPELVYSRQETTQLVHEMIDSLSEEQRICILMFHIEGASISQIADTLGCSENTVKSRLNYGRKNLKLKAEQMQKKGYKLFSAAPVSLLIFLLKKDEIAMSAEGAFDLVSDSLKQKVLSKVCKMSANAQPQISSAAQNVSKLSSNAVKTSFIHTVAGKVTVAVISACVIGGGIFYSATHLSGNNAQPTQQNTVSQSSSIQEEEAKTSKEMTDSDYESMIAGNLTKEEMQFVLAYGPQEMTENSLSETDYTLILNTLTQAPNESGSYIEEYDPDSNWKSVFSLTDTNRLFSSFTDYRFTEENDTDTENGIDVDGEYIKFFPATLNYVATATITSAEYTDEKMEIYFTFEKTTYDSGNKKTEKSDKLAVLKPNADGKYVIVEISQVSQTAQENSESQSAQTSSTEQSSQSESTASQSESSGKSIKDLYAEVLSNVAKGADGYGFSDMGNPTGNYNYFIADMNADGIPELIVSQEFLDRMDTVTANNCRVFSCKKNGSGYELYPISGEFSAEALYIASDNNGLYRQDFMRGTGDVYIYRISVTGDSVNVSDSADYEFTFGTAELEQFGKSNSLVEWTQVSDTGKLNELN